MALEALHIAYRGEHPVFLYGQNYMGTIEAYLGALLFHIFGVSSFSIRLGLALMFALFLVWVAPGDPFQNERNLDPIVRETLKRQFHAESATSFLAHHVWNIVRHGDFGPRQSAVDGHPAVGRLEHATLDVREIIDAE